MSLVQMKLLPDTVAVVKRIHSFFDDSQSLTDTVARCIHVTAKVVDALRDGKTIRIVDSDGIVDRLVVPGLRNKDGAL